MPDSDSLTNHKGESEMKDLSHFTFLSELFRYPYAEQLLHAVEWRNIVHKYDPGLIRYLDPFIQMLENKTPEYCQEYFVSTFYVQPVCCLDIGYVLFGEDYRRGEFMANLSREHRLAGNDRGTELPDHLPVLLTLLPKMSDQELAEELIFSLMIPALHEMIDGFRKDGNVYRDLLRLLVAVLERDFPESKYERFSFRREKRSEVTTAETKD